MRLKKFIVLMLLLSAGMTGAAQVADSQTPGVSEMTTQVRIYPNPAPEFLFVKFENFRSEDVVLSVHNILGNRMEIETEVVDDYQMRVNVKDLPSGYYLLAVKDDKDRFRGTFKFLKR